MKYVVNKIVELIYANGPSKDKETINSGIRTTSWIYDALRRSICIQ